jgi:hypothetical protein
MIRYKDTLVGKGSQLEAALHMKPAETAAKEAKKVYNRTSEQYAKMYPAEDRKWFAQWGKPELSTNNEMTTQ